MIGITKKPAVMASPEFAAMFNQLSKQALIDSLWCACQLGTDETNQQITTQAARNAKYALHARGDRMPADIVAQAERAIESD
jgi:hypothetical protein